jgi:chromosome partitioning protein
MGELVKSGKVIAIANRKGGVGKTMTAVSLAVGLARQGKRVLCIDTDSQGSLTASLGVSKPDKLPVTLADVMLDIINERDFDITAGTVHHLESGNPASGVDLLPANNSLSGVELALVQIMGREGILRQYTVEMKKLYDFIIADCSPTLGLLTVNALAAADSVIIPVAPKYLDALGLELLLKSVTQIRRKINLNLKIEGILLTMADRRSKLTREVIASIENAYGGSIKIFSEHIPQSVRAAETSANGISIFTHDPKGKVAAAYAALTREVSQ